jgi:hypothetical protein
MDLLSMVGMATKRRSDYYEQAKTLARKYKEQPILEERMKAESLGLVKGLKDKLMRWEEYERTMLDKTLTSALASVILGTKSDKPNEKMEKVWPIIVGDMLPPLTKFLAETKEYIDSGVLRLGDQTADFSDYDLTGAVPGAIDLDTDELEGVNPEEEGTNEARQRRAQGQTWPALAERVSRYLATPTFSFYSLGEYMVAQDQGFKEMKRMAKHDKRTCIDCKTYGEQGWAPIGELPMPGKGCRCYDRCRCTIEYR